MTRTTLPVSFRSLGDARGAAVVLRMCMLLAPLAVAGCTRMASGSTHVAVDLAVATLAAWCALAPDTAVGLVVVLVLAVQWWVSVDDPVSPWSVPAAALLAVFHASSSAAGVAPPGARWTRAMCARWGRNGALLAATGACTWLVAFVLHERSVGGGSVLVAAALLVLALGALWARGGSLAGPRHDRRVGRVRSVPDGRPSARP